MLVPRDPRTRRTSSSRSAPAPAATRRPLRGRALPHVLAVCRKEALEADALDMSTTGVGGAKEVIAHPGKACSAGSSMRAACTASTVPSTESSGRIHTSTVTVAVIPEAEDVDVQIEQKDPDRHLLLVRPRRTEREHHLLRVRITTSRRRSVACQDERSHSRTARRP